MKYKVRYYGFVIVEADDAQDALDKAQNGVYIKGMEMPKSCYACTFFAQIDCWNKEDETDTVSYCKRTGEKTWESVNGYLPNCPLVPVRRNKTWQE